MKNLSDRLDELKNDLEPYLQSRMIFLLNPKDTKILEAVVAWTVLPKPDVSTIIVEDNASMETLWDIVKPDIFRFATILGCNVQSALPRLNQLKELSIIYPDGSVANIAMTLANVYIKNQVGKIQPKEKKESN